MKIIRDYTLILLVLATAFTSNAQTYKNVQYGNFENWVVRDIEESLVIGGNTKYFHNYKSYKTWQNYKK